ncbi:MAG: hypothetical protein D6B28_07760 [Gammaproteobacteria bacterium]|nr:MAG: hypothetical protein D6B28_07760 [Gammaproteobacteria bacterium]
MTYGGKIVSQAETNRQPVSNKSNISHLQYVHPDKAIITHSDDEIDLIELIQSLIKHKFSILLSIIFSLLLAIVYLYITPPVFQATSYFYPPSPSKVQLLNISWLSGYEKVDEGEIYSVFLKNLKSRSLQKQFFERNNLEDHFSNSIEANTLNHTLFEKFSELISSKVNKDKHFGSLSIEWSNPAIAAKWANSYVKFAEQKTTDFFYNNLRGAIDKKISDIELNIASKRKLSQKRREDRIALLEESAKIAKTLGIDPMQNSTNNLPRLYLGPNQSQAYSGDMYLRGEKALLSEAKVLRNRNNDDAFIPGLRNLQEELDKLRSIKIDTNSLRAISLDQPAFPPSGAIKPKKFLILALTICLGAIMGILIVLAKSFLKTFHATNSEK